MWTAIVEGLNLAFHNILNNYLTTAIVTALGLTGAVYMWVTKTTLNQLWDRFINPALKTVAAYWDMSNIEKKNLKKYKDAVEKGDLDEIAKAGEDLLNGKSSKRR